MTRPLTFILLFFLAVQTHGLHADSPRAKTLVRFKSQCDGGSGKACYDYGRAVWSERGGDHKTAMQYLSRGCALKYKLACDSTRDHSVRTRHTHRRNRDADAPGAVCFSSNELSTARLAPNPVSKSGVLGQKIDMIKPKSFWDKVGLQENDVIIRVNNMPFNSSQETMKVFGAAGKKFGFEVRRGGETITLWYTCL